MKHAILSFPLIGLMGLFAAIQTTAAAAQDPRDPRPDWVRRNEEKRRDVDKLSGRDEKGMIAKPAAKDSSPAATAVDAERKNKQRAAEEEKRRTLEEINQKFSAPAEYHVKYAEFLKQKNTGLARIFPDKNCGEGKVVTYQELERCGHTPQIKGAGSLYSFRLFNIPANLPLQLILFYAGQSDIHFVGDKLVVGTPTTLAAIGEIGQREIGEIDSKNEALRFLSELKPAGTKTRLESQRKILEQGVNANGYSYYTSARVGLNKTYVLRSVAYYEKYPSFWNTDLLVVFKIVGQEKEDGSIIMLWKQLKQKNAPLLENK